MRELCDICQGREVINLPVYGLVQPGDMVLKVSDEAHRSFPCPQCAQTVDEARVAIFQCETEAPPERSSDPDFMRAISYSHGTRIAHEFVRAGFVAMRVVEQHDREWPGVRDRIRSRLGVVSAARVASIEQRAVEAGAAIATEVVRVAEQKISHFGSFYQLSSITKAEAYALISEALAAVLKKHREQVK